MESRIRAAECLNPPAVKSILPITEMKTKMVMAGFSKDQILGALRTSLRKGTLPPLEPGAMSYMMAKGSYLTDKMNSNGPHLMFYISLENPTAWSAFSKNSPVGYSPYWSDSSNLRKEYNGFPLLGIYTVDVPAWSDGTAGPH